MFSENTREKSLTAAFVRYIGRINSGAFIEFLKLGMDRCGFISAWLTENEIPHKVVPIAKKKHIIIKYSPQNYSSAFKVKTLVAHYDREKNTEGANDNSAACFQLMLFAKTLLKINSVHNIIIIFTDGEEAGAKGITKQGSYLLGTGLKKLGMENSDIFVFDMCGRGDTLILSQSGICGRPKERVLALDILHSEACAYAEKACPNNWLSLLTPYSDNAGFIASGLSAQVITVLPYDEAKLLLQYLPKNISSHFFKFTEEKNKTAIHSLIELIIKNKKPQKNSPFKNIIPQTWQLMHTIYDTAETLTPSAFFLIENYLHCLAGI
ncbi:M28 family peptidase [Treponema pedis]|uniref:M28 family peptidase n=1 Tax=Treponema pedis TaxID=409322 RepID=A0A7S6WNS7_9SPIR|nr:M28 family peptidase [Treponema pedis]QOW60558.1 M28 family peptidase [Treponema pedis]